MKSEASSTHRLVAAGLKLRVGAFVLDAGGEQLLDLQGNVVVLRPQAWAVLRHLALNAGRLVTKAELLDAIWPGLVVTEGSLTQAVSDVRDALGEVGRRVIKTVPKRGYMLVAGAVEPPPCASRLTNLPAEVDPLIGREADVATLRQWLAQHRLVTVLGTGGIGKTRLAQAVANELVESYVDGVWWIDLAALSDAQQVRQAIAMAMNLELGRADPPALAGRSLADHQLQPEVIALQALARALARRSVLVVLDNAEHLTPAVAALASALLRQASGVRILVTSREPLLLREEVVLRLEGLCMPSEAVSADLALDYGAIALFLKRTRSADRRFEITPSNVGAVVDICRQLDGLPLAIEMAAARVPSLGVSGLAEGLTRRWHLLSARDRTADARHQSLLATLDWSYDLLDATQQRTFRRLAVFNGGFTLEAARQVAFDASDSTWGIEDALVALIDKSMIVTNSSDPPRFRWLVTVRQYALQRLADVGEQATLGERHARWCLGFFSAAEDAWWTRPTQHWLSAVLPEMDNLRAAIAWCFGSVGNVELGVRLVAASLLMWERLADDNHEARTLADQALSRISNATEAAVRAQLYFVRGCYYEEIDLTSALQSFRRALEPGGLDDRNRAYALVWSARLMGRIGDFDAAAVALEEAGLLCRRVRHSTLDGLLGLAWGFLHELRSEYKAACTHYERAMQSFDVARNSALAATARNDLADCSWAMGDLAKAEALLRHVIAQTRGRPAGLGDNSGIPELNLAGVLVERGDLQQALSWAREAIPRLWRSEHLWSAYDCLSLIAAQRGDLERAVLLHGLSDAVYAEAGLGMREPNEARMHARVRALLLDAMEPEELQVRLSTGSALGEDQACAMAQEAVREAAYENAAASNIRSSRLA